MERSTTVRTMTPADRTAVERLSAATYGEGFEHADAFAAKIAAGVAVVAVDAEDTVVGYGVALPWRGELPGLQSRPDRRPAAPEYLYVHDVCVAGSHRRRGIAPAIMRTLERCAADMELPTMRCIAVHGAEVLWRRLGWLDDGAAVPPDFPAGSVAMTKRVAAA
jgi:GNAT superfamily N-acetyltransferase